MPIYVYRCPECGHTYELLESRDSSLPFCGRCPTPSKDDPAPLMERLPTTAAIRLKGPGFHTNDYGKGTT